MGITKAHKLGAMKLGKGEAGCLTFPSYAKYTQMVAYLLGES